MNINELRPADVLLYSSTTWVSNLIRKLDGTEVTHAGVFLGDGLVGEALMVGNRGVNANPISTIATNWIEVRRLVDDGLERQPILNVANGYIADGNRYAYAEALLLGVVLVTRQVDYEDTRLGRIALNALRRANNWIEDKFSQGKEPMVCSEFVFRCYDEADPADQDSYTLEILSQSDWSARKGFSRRRIGERIVGQQSRLNLPTIHPESLLAESLKETHALGMPASVAQPEVSDAELDRLIEEYLRNESEPKQEDKSVYTAMAVSTEDLKQATIEFAQKLELAKGSAKKGGVLSDATPDSRILATFADFVTPGDLLKSPSLQSIGRILPQ